MPVPPLYSAAPNLPTGEPAERWSILAGVTLSLVLHGAAWLIWTNWRSAAEPVETPPQIIEVALMAAPPRAAPILPATPEPPQPAPKLDKAPEKPVPKKPDKPKPLPKPKPKSEPHPEAPPVPPVEKVSAPPESASPAPPAQSEQAKPEAPAPVPYVEASYKAPGLNNPPKRYPRVAQERQWEGTVTLNVLVLADGSPGEIRVERSSGHELLDEATIEQVKNWRFIPARKGDQAVPSRVVVPIEYKLKH